ncbi:MAG: IS66 family transposase [Roseobacter sp.]|jgi:transposase|nr:IS66 family transposase [Roseobacter sp.]
MAEERAATPSFDELAAEGERLKALVAQQATIIERQAERIGELEARLTKDSHNSSKPPSSDPPFRKPPPRSQRKASGRKPGGQKGHKGANRALVDEADHLVVMGLEGACDCGRCRSQIDAQPLPERRQVIELVIRREVTEYRVVAGTCACGRMHRSDFPEEIGAPVQYGPGVSAFAVYMTQYQLLPFERTAAVLDELAGIAISPGSLYSAVATASARVQAPVAAIGEALVAAPLAHADETGVRVGRALHWLHVLSTANLTAYFPHPKRGGEAIEAGGLLPRFAGILVHDHWKPYTPLACQHAYCNAHHLRELTAIAEAIPSQRPWTEDMIALLCEANTLTIEARAAGFAALPGPMVLDIQTRYDAILDVAKARNPAREPKPGSRRRVRQSPAHNLVNRLSEKREGVLRFVTDLRVPFDNNQAERDVRMPKLKQKVSGCFRSDQGFAHFAVIRSYLSTLRKQSADIYKSLVLTFQGSPPMPRLAPE